MAAIQIFLIWREEGARGFQTVVKNRWLKYLLKIYFESFLLFIEASMNFIIENTFGRSYEVFIKDFTEYLVHDLQIGEYVSRAWLCFCKKRTNRLQRISTEFHAIYLSISREYSSFHTAEINHVAQRRLLALNRLVNLGLCHIVYFFFIVMGGSKYKIRTQYEDM